MLHWLSLLPMTPCLWVPKRRLITSGYSTKINHVYIWYHVVSTAGYFCVYVVCQQIHISIYLYRCEPWWHPGILLQSTSTVIVWCGVATVKVVQQFTHAAVTIHRVKGQGHWTALMSLSWTSAVTADFPCNTEWRTVDLQYTVWLDYIPGVLLVYHIQISYKWKWVYSMRIISYPAHVDLHLNCGVKNL